MPNFDTVFTDLVMNQQLELSLSSLNLAENTPEQGSIHEMCDELESAIAHLNLPLYQKLEVAGNIVSRIAKVYDQKANQLLDSWEFARQPAVFPVIELGDLDSYIRQTMSIDVDAFLEPSSRRKANINPELNEFPDSNWSVAHMVEKSAALGLVDILELAGNDSPAQWSQAIAEWVEQQDGDVVATLPELCEALNLAPVEIWLGLLLGNFQNHKVILGQNEFYQSITVAFERLPVDKIYRVPLQRSRKPASVW